MNRPFAVAAVCIALASIDAAFAETQPAIRKVEDIVIYRDERFHSAFPSIVRRPGGELIVAFRRAPDRRLLGDKGYTHTDPNSYLMDVRSRDGGKTWSAEPEMIYAHPFGGSQDPCMVQLRSGTLVCASYGWALLKTNYTATLTNTAVHPSGLGGFAFLGGYVLNSKDGGKTWNGPFKAPAVPTNPARDAFNKPVAAFNRGAMVQGRDGKLYWAVAASSESKPRRTQTHLMVSSDEGQTWEYSGPIAADPKITFSETSLYETPKGDLVAFMRTADFDDHTVVARSTDHGKSFQKWQDAGFQGHPHYALRLPDKRVLLVYGYRHAPMGIRARVLNPECTDFATAQEYVLRDDGGSVDLGYPWATMLSRNRALVVYYFNQKDGTRYIAGTILEIPR